MRNREYSRRSRVNSRKLAPANYLIVCEGRKTEPNYFNGLKKKINEKYGNKVDVLLPDIEVKGTGKNTTDLVRYTSQFVNYSNKKYGKVWIVFDKDDYSDEQFDKAIENCFYDVAWSNPNFELWLLLHFRKVINYVSKDDIFVYLDKEFQKNNGLTKAIANSKNLELLNNKIKKPSENNPMTMVYKIVVDLEEYL